MPGLRVDFDVLGEEQVVHEMLGMSDRLGDPAPVLKSIADDLRQIEEFLFATEDAWAPLKEATVRAKIAKGYPFPAKILHATLDLRDSLTQPTQPGGFAIVTYDALYFGTHVDYAKFHKFGTRYMPKRDPLTLTDSHRRAFSKKIQRWSVEGERALFGLPSGPYPNVFGY